MLQQFSLCSRRFDHTSVRSQIAPQHSQTARRTNWIVSTTNYVIVPDLRTIHGGSQRLTFDRLSI